MTATGDFSTPLSVLSGIQLAWISSIAPFERALKESLVYSKGKRHPKVFVDDSVGFAFLTLIYISPLWNPMRQSWFMIASYSCAHCVRTAVKSWPKTGNYSHTLHQDARQSFLLFLICRLWRSACCSYAKSSTRVKKWYIENNKTTHGTCSKNQAKAKNY